MRICIVGNGIVGGTLRRWLIGNTNHDIAVYDPPQGEDWLSREAHAYFISVPVPTKGFKQDISLIAEALEVLSKDSYPGAKIFVRSTVLPGTCDALHGLYGLPIYAMPEFLTERTREEDFVKQPLLVGIPQSQIDSESSWAHQDEICRFMREVTNDRKDVNFTTNKTAEMTKYAHNVFGAVKVTFFNGIARLCEQHGIKYENVRQLIQMSGYINEPHTLVPGPDGKKGFGGKCFPKDLEAFIGFAGMQAEHYFLKDVLCLNRFYRGEKNIESTEGDLNASAVDQEAEA